MTSKVEISEIIYERTTQRHPRESCLPELRGLQDMLHEVNAYVSFLRQGANDVRMIIRADGGPDPRRYNAPTAPKIAIIMPGDGYTEGVATRDIVLHARTGSLQSITECNCAYDSLLCSFVSFRREWLAFEDPSQQRQW